MNRIKLVSLLVPALAALPFLFAPTHAQNSGLRSKEVVRTKSISRTMRFGPGGTISRIGSPEGSITIEGWQKNQVEVSAEIEVRGATEKDAARIANVTGFQVDEDVTILRIYSLGPHDRKYLKTVDKKFPKKLRDNYFRINYKISVPEFSDLRIDGGRGDMSLKGVEGVFSVNYLESNAVLNLIGGSIHVTVGKGNVDVTIGTRSWRGRAALIQVATGDIDLRLPKNLNADLIAKILRSGRIENAYQGLAPKQRTEFSEHEMNAVAGSGGASLAFTVGDGNIRIVDLEKPSP